MKLKTLIWNLVPNTKTTSCSVCPLTKRTFTLFKMESGMWATNTFIDGVWVEGISGSDTEIQAIKELENSRNRHVLNFFE